MQRNRSIRHIAAFTLIEMSIMLVIIGLLVGGVLIGQYLIQVVQLNAAVTDANRFGIAAMTFRDKYQALPGDMNNAADIWGAADGGDGLGSDCGDVESETLTCNGDGSGLINVLINNGGHEKLRAWQQLANAGMIAGSYTGAPTAGIAYVGTQWPAARYKPAGYEMHGPLNLYIRGTGHLIKIGARSTIDTTGLNGGFLTPIEAWSLDQKMDNGLSDSGNLLALDSNDVAGCVTNGSVYALGTTGSYILTNEIKSCRFYFYSDF